MKAISWNHPKSEGEKSDYWSSQIHRTFVLIDLQFQGYDQAVFLEELASNPRFIGSFELPGTSIGNLLSYSYPHTGQLPWPASRHAILSQQGLSFWLGPPTPLLPSLLLIAGDTAGSSSPAPRGQLANILPYQPAVIFSLLSKNWFWMICCHWNDAALSNCLPCLSAGASLALLCDAARAWLRDPSNVEVVIPVLISLQSLENSPQLQEGESSGVRTEGTKKQMEKRDREEKPDALRKSSQ